MKPEAKQNAAEPKRRRVFLPSGKGDVTKGDVAMRAGIVDDAR
jgi:hypothetical protein